MSLDIKFKKLHPEAKLPMSMNLDDAAYDIHCLESFSIGPGETKVVDTGLQIADICMNPSWISTCANENPSTTHYLQILGRSGLASKGIFPQAGVIDLTFRGNLKIVLYNGNQCSSMTPIDVINVIRSYNNQISFEFVQEKLDKENAEKTYHFKAGHRIAQMIINKIVNKRSVNMLESADIIETARGNSGFGSTGQ